MSNGMIRWLKHIRQRYIYRKEHREWISNGKPPAPPHLVKQRAIREYGKRFSLGTLVESGTYLGEMVEAQRKHFRRIISIELSEMLCAKAQEKFRPYPHIEILQEDSGKLIKDIVGKLSAPALFWLDGHFSGGNTAKADLETPVLNELDAILKSGHKHVILIDDARLFNGEHDYPTIEALKEFVAKRNANYVLEVKDDIIRLTTLST